MISVDEDIEWQWLSNLLGESKGFVSGRFALIIIPIVVNLQEDKVFE